MRAENDRHIIASLLADGSPAAMSASMIQKGVGRDLYAAALEPEERNAILAVLENPRGRVEELRGALARDQCEPLQPLAGGMAGELREGAPAAKVGPPPMNR